MLKFGDKNVLAMSFGDSKVTKAYLGNELVFSAEAEELENLYITVVEANGYIFNASTNTGTSLNYPYYQGDDRYTLFLPVEEGASYLWKTESKGDRYVVWYIPYEDYTPSLSKMTAATHPEITRGVSANSAASVKDSYIIEPPSGTKWLMIYYSLNTIPTGITINKIQGENA